jgi:hypothetical protein
VRGKFRSLLACGKEELFFYRTVRAIHPAALPASQQPKIANLNDKDRNA